MENIFESKSISPMLIKHESNAFNDSNYIYELKLDGSRCLAYLDRTGTDLRNKRNDKMISKFPELANLHKQVKYKCILDGELFVMDNNKPDFSLLQKRALMTHSFKIELASKSIPASFVAFDILYYRGRDITLKPLMERKEKLAANVIENDRIAVSRYIEKNGIDLFELTRKQNLEGIIAKRKDSKYYIGKRTNDWIKIKNMCDDDFIICGYIMKKKLGRTLVLGQYFGDQLVYKGNVTGISRETFDRILSVPKAGNPFAEDIPKSNEEAIWIEPFLVCKVEYMHKTKQGGLRQPAFRGLRDDKDPKECRERISVYK